MGKAVKPQYGGSTHNGGLAMLAPLGRTGHTLWGPLLFFWRRDARFLKEKRSTEIQFSQNAGYFNSSRHGTNHDKTLKDVCIF